jgi:hypothetical protein
MGEWILQYLQSFQTDLCATDRLALIECVLDESAPSTYPAFRRLGI